jgi:hypothetical protein
MYVVCVCVRVCVCVCVCVCACFQYIDEPFPRGNHAETKMSWNMFHTYVSPARYGKCPFGVIDLFEVEFPGGVTVLVLVLVLDRPRLKYLCIFDL